MTEEALHSAVLSNDLAKVRLLLQIDDIDINWANPADCSNTPLHVACRLGHHDVTFLLLAHPRIFVNPRNLTGGTPFHTACSFHTKATVKPGDSVQLLLNDSRVAVDAVDTYGATGFWLACFWGHLGVVKCFLASEREFNVLAQGKSLASGKASTPLEIALEMGKLAVSCWLKRFAEEPEQTRAEAKIELGLIATIVPHLFALAVFLSDDYLAISSPSPHSGFSTKHPQQRRFWRILARLPLELQMILSHRMYGSSRDLILAKDSEVAFRQIALWKG